MNDAQAHQLHEDPAHYIEPGVLWWAFDREKAQKRGSTLESIYEAVEPGDQRNHERSVVLVDEIDKADPDAPNDLLVPLGSGQFPVQEIGIRIKALHPPLVFITTNEERALSNAFLRRCIVLALEPPNKDRLIEIAIAHFGSGINEELYRTIATHMIKLRAVDHSNAPDFPNAAEYLDTVRVCLKLGITPSSKNKIWEIITNMTIIKPRDLPGGV